MEKAYVPNFTIEDCLELLTGLNKLNGYKFEIQKEDYNILTSVARQVFKGIALTDRQFDMLVRKFENYKEQFATNNIDIDNIISNKVLRTPFREVDRTQKVFIEGKQIIAQFPFNKKLIQQIQDLRTYATGQVTNSKNRWQFDLTEKNIKVVGDVLTKFEFSEEFTTLYNTISSYMLEDWVPGIYQKELKNLHPKAKANAEAACGEFDTNVIKYIDRRMQYGIEHIDVDYEIKTLADRIAFRKSSLVYIKNESVTLEELVDSLDQLSRYPILVVVDEERFDTIYDIDKLFDKHSVKVQRSVMFRIPNDSIETSKFNQWVRDNKLNNWVDNRTKIVYISSIKIPKPVLMNFKPQCILNLSKNLRSYGSAFSWLASASDLRIDYGHSPLIKSECETLE